MSETWSWELLYRVNCLKFLRMINVFQKSKFKQLQSSWYLSRGSTYMAQYYYAFPYRDVNFSIPLVQVRALHYLHSNRIIHRDMKPQNILIGAGSVVKVDKFYCWRFFLKYSLLCLLLCQPEQDVCQPHCLKRCKERRNIIWFSVLQFDIELASCTYNRHKRCTDADIERGFDVA